MRKVKAKQTKLCKLDSNETKFNFKSSFCELSQNSVNNVNIKKRQSFMNKVTQIKSKILEKKLDGGLTQLPTITITGAFYKVAHSNLEVGENRCTPLDLHRKNIFELK